MKVLTEYFSQVLEMSMIAAVVIAVVLLIRSLIYKFPKQYSYYLWAVVLFRLICPVSFSSVFSIFNLHGDKLKQLLGRTGVSVPEVWSEPAGIITVNAHKYATEAMDFEYPPSSSDFIAIEKSAPMWLQVTAILWIVGIAVVLLYSIYTYWKFRKIVEKATLLQENIYECENIPSPFVMGIFSPKIYMPYRLEEKEQEYVLAHERYHIKRCDHVIKALAFLILTIYWFHPLVWAAYFLACRDMEMSCDEKVLSILGNEIKQDYSMLLLSFAANQRMRFAGPLAFGESDTGKRVKNVLQFHKPRLWGSVLSIILLAAVILGCATDGTKEESKEKEAIEAIGEDARNDELKSTDIKNADIENIDNTDIGSTTGESTDVEGTDAENIDGEALIFLQNWATAFCNRDGKAIYDMASEESYEMLADSFLLEKHGDEFSFGWSSPWPMNADTDWKIDSLGNGKAVILYYAWTSDPHVTVWRSELGYEKVDDKFRCTPEKVEIMDAIESIEEFLEAYPQGIIVNTQMDYLTNGMGEALNKNTNANRSTILTYEELFSPYRAAKNLLNLSDHVEVRELIYQKSAEEEKNSYVRVLFPDESVIYVRMQQIFDENGIWIPQTIISEAELEMIVEENK